MFAPMYPQQQQPIRPPESTDPMQVAQQANALRLGQQQLAAGQMQLQQQQMDLQDQMKWRQAWRDANGNMDQAIQAAAQAGVGPRTLIPIQQQVLALKSEQAKLSQTQSEALDLKHDGLHALLAPVAGIKDPVAQKAAWDKAMESAVQQGYASPSEAAMHPYPGSQDAVQNYILGLNTVKWLSADASQKQAAARETIANTGSSKESREANQQSFQNAISDLGANPPASAQDYQDRVGKLPYQIAKRIFAAVPPGQYDPQQSVATIRQLGMTPEQQTQSAAGAKRLGMPQTEAELAIVATDPHRTPEERAAANAALRRLDQSKIAARPVTTINMPAPNLPPVTSNTPSGEDYIRTLPAAIQGTVRAIVDGRQKLPSGMALRTPYWAGIVQAVNQADPQWSEQRGEIRKSFTTGADGRNIGSLNTASVHLDQLDQAAQAMQNGSFVPGNAVWNRMRSMFGSAAPTNFESLKAAVAGEMANALKGNATDPEIGNMSRNLQAANSPAQLSGAIDTNLHILGAKLNTYHQRYQQQIPGDSVWSPVLPSARAVFQKHGFDPTAGPVNSNLPGSSISPAVTKALASQGPGIHTLSDGTRWMKAADGTITRQ
jgi:hypothetical protein